MDRGPDSRPVLSSNLIAHCPIFRRLLSKLRRFGANFSKVSKSPFGVKKRMLPNHGRQLTRAAQNIKERPAIIARATGARGRDLPGHAMACSLRGSLQGFNGAKTTHHVRPYELASHFPHMGQAHQFLALPRPGHREAPLLTSNHIRVPQAAPRCKQSNTDNFFICNR